MAKHNKLQRSVFKINSSKLKQSDWNLKLRFEDALVNGEVVFLAESTVLRWIDELNGTEDCDDKAREINRQIRWLGRQPNSHDNRIEMKRLWRERNRVLFKEDYVLVVMDTKKDYREVCENGFEVNGIRYHRLLTTTGGVKAGTVVFTSERLWPELRRRLDNGRDLEKKIVPAKFGAYESLACSSSIPLSPPKGILVVHDAYTDFTEDVITLDNRDGGEPKMEFVKGYEIHKDVSDGFGTMTPERAQIWSEELGLDGVLSGMSTRMAFEKGMLVTFDHIEFAEKVNGASADNPNGYLVKDVWGDLRDVRDYDVVLTESMLKLWDSYKSLEDYLDNCRENHYEFSTPKQAPLELENVWTTNYQFIQSYEFTDDDIEELVRPTIDNIKDAMGGDYRKLMLYLGGKTITPESFFFSEDNCVKALMVDKREIRDPYIRQKAKAAIRKRIDQAKMGKLDVHGHFEIACGDPFALWQSIFELPVTGLLGAGEVYSEYWRGSDEVVLFRAPMSVHNNIKKVKVNSSGDVQHWFKYIHTMLVMNAWDSATDAMNGEDFDGDMNFITDNAVLLRRTRKTPTIFCIQHRAEKHKITEQLLIDSDINGFGNQIGKITNDITSQFDIQTKFEPETLEYDTLAYRIICGQLYQQDFC